MHEIHPDEFSMYMDHSLTDTLVSGRIGAYLKRGLQVQKAAPESARFSFNSFEEALGTERTPGGRGSRTDRPRPKGATEDINRTPAASRKANLSTPIGNLLTDLRTMHDAM